MIGANVARRYARALLEIGNETRTLSALVSEVTALASAYEESTALQRALDNPLVTHEAKKAIQNRICADGAKW